VSHNAVTGIRVATYVGRAFGPGLGASAGWFYETPNTGSAAGLAGRRVLDRGIGETMKTPSQRQTLARP
jgi:hypothetical protein